MRALELVVAVWAVCAAASAPGEPEDGPILRTRAFALQLTPRGALRGLLDVRTGANMLGPASAQMPGTPTPFIAFATPTGVVSPDRVTAVGDTVVFGCSNPAIELRLKVRDLAGALQLTVERLRGQSGGDLLLAQVCLPAGRHNAQSGLCSNGRYAVCVRGLGSNVHLSAQPGPSVCRVAAVVNVRYAQGASVLLVAGSAGSIADRLRSAVRSVPGRWSPTGGPFALRAPENRGSYVFASDVTEKNLDEWIALARRAGLTTLHLIGWEQSLGTYEPNARLYPGGVAQLKRIVDRIHAAGLKVGMHTLSGGIGVNDPLVTPTPDPRLAVDVSFTLDAPVDAAGAEIFVREKPVDLEKVWAYMGRGNVLRIGSELIQYSGYTDAPPYRFTGCARGAFGTQARGHAAGDRADHLYVRYGTFSADPDNGLEDYVASRIADVANGCGFDMIYMDGAEGMPGGERGVARMREAIFVRLKRRTLVEGSEWGYASWWFHSRVGAYDYPNWGLKRFIDEHCRQNDDYRGLALLPAQIGWWSVFGPNADRWAQTPDEIEYLCSKSLAYDMPMSFQGLGLGEPENARQPEYLDVIGRYERLRLARSVPSAVLARLREPARDVRLRTGSAGGWAFVPEDYLKRRVETTGAEPVRWRLGTRFGPAPARVRIRALDVAEDAANGTSQVVADLGAASAVAAAGSGGQAKCARAEVRCPDGSAATRLSVSDESAWASFTVSLAPPRDLRSAGALGVWVKGDGSRAVLNFQLTNPLYHWQTFDEHYVALDFIGWRYVELHFRERDAERFWDLGWPYGDLYSVNRNPLIRSEVDRLAVWVGGMKSKQPVDVLVSPVRALPLQPVSTVANPSLTVGDAELRFGVTLSAGEWIECDEPGVARHYDRRGKLLATIQAPAALPRIGPDSEVSFRCDGPRGKRARAEVTLMVPGPEITAVPGSVR